MIFEIWTYKATLPNSNQIKTRPVLIIGDDSENELNIVDIHYCMVSASSLKGKYDVDIEEKTAKNLGLTKASIIKTTKIYTGSRGLLGDKICDLPNQLKNEFIDKYKKYQDSIVCTMNNNLV